MPEQLTPQPNPEVSRKDVDDPTYKWLVERAESRKAWLDDKTVRGRLKRIMSEVGDALLLQLGASRERNARMLGAPQRYLEKESPQGAEVSGTSAPKPVVKDKPAAHQNENRPSSS